MIKIEHLVKNYGSFCAVDDISFSVEYGEFVSVLGPNGVGKSTLFRCLLGNFPYEGSVLVDGEELRGLSPGKRAKKIAYIPQNHRPTFGYTVLDTALMGTTRQISPFLSPGKAQVAQAREALRRVGAEHLEGRSFERLSGGEQQRVAIARALINRPSVVLADEPTGNLDTHNRDEIQRLLFEVREKFGQTIVMVTHDERLAEMADRKIVMSDGQVL